MKIRFQAIVILVSILFSAFVFAGKDTARAEKLASALPASDGVLTLDVDQLFGRALPQILIENKPMLAKIDREIEKIRVRTGLNLKDFDHLAAGLKSRKSDDGSLVFEPIVLAYGAGDAESLIEVAKLASKSKFRTERYAGRDLYVFSSETIIDQNKPKTAGNTLLDSVMNKVIGSLSGELAITAFDEKTVAFGTLPRVKEAVGEAPRISNRVLSMVRSDGSSVGKMGMLLPEGMSAFLDLDDDELGSALDAIRELRGSLGVIPQKTLLSIAAAAADDSKAEELEFVILGLQAVFSKILKRQNGADKQVYGKMLEELKVTRNGNEILLDLEILQSDLNVIVGKK